MEDAVAVEAMLTTSSHPELIQKLVGDLDCSEPTFLQVRIARVCVVVVPSGKSSSAHKGAVRLLETINMCKSLLSTIYDLL